MDRKLQKIPHFCLSHVPNIKRQIIQREMWRKNYFALDTFLTVVLNFWTWAYGCGWFEEMKCNDPASWEISHQGRGYLSSSDEDYITEQECHEHCAITTECNFFNYQAAPYETNCILYQSCSVTTTTTGQDPPWRLYKMCHGKDYSANRHTGNRRSTSSDIPMFIYKPLRPLEPLHL